jgi:nitronate monooxygenase
VIAAGGIMDGRGIAAALALGAQAAALGTAFLTTAEAGVPDAHKWAIRDATEESLTITHAFSGRPARGIRNRVSDDFDADPTAIASYPIQNDLTRPMRAAAAQADDARYLSLWCGQAPRLARSLSTGELVRALAAEAHAVVAALRQIDAVEVAPVNP